MLSECAITQFCCCILKIMSSQDQLHCVNNQGRPSPLRPCCISPLFQIFPLFSKKCRTQRKIFTILPFPDKFLDFLPRKFPMTFFLVIDHKFRISSLFSLFQYYYPPLL